MIFFDTPGKPDAVEKKVMEFNDALAAGGSTSALAMTAEDTLLFRQLVGAFPQIPCVRSQKHGT